MQRKKWKQWILVIITLCGLLGSPLLPIRGGILTEIVNTSQQPDLDPSDFTIEVILGDEQRYTVINAYILRPDGTEIGEIFMMIAHETLQKDHELLVTITKIDQRKVWYDIDLRQSDGNYQKLETDGVCRHQSFCLYSKFVTTTNRVLLEDSLQENSNIQYDITDLILNLTRTVWYTDRKMGYNWTYVYELSTGWLLSLHYRVWNKTHLLREYEIRNNIWSTFWSTHSSFWSTHSSFWSTDSYLPSSEFGFIFFVTPLFLVLRWQRKKKKN